MRVRIKDILNKTDGKYLFVDLIMMAVLGLNLFLILFDFSFSSDFFKGIFLRYTPDFYEFYNVHIHRDFLAIDFWFVIIFIIELVIRWIIAVKKQKYHRWFFYPFIHWYDVLGCIPLGSFRFLRVLRVFGLTVRLHKLGVIDITKTYPYQKFIKYLNILTEEVSDRVVLHVLSGVQEEINNGNPVLDQILNDLIEPQREEIVDWVSRHLQQATLSAYHNHIDELQDYLNDKVVSAIEQNRELKIISKIPMVGHVVTNNLENTVSDMINTVVDECFQDLASTRNREVVNDVAHLVLDTFVSDEKDQQLNSMVKNIILESLEMVKEHVRIQQWKVQEQLIRDEKQQSKMETAESTEFSETTEIDEN